MLVLYNSSFAQKNEIGGGIGVTNYKGDINRNYHPNNTSLGLTLLYKRNLSYISAFRFHTVLAEVSGSDSYSNTKFSSLRNKSFTSRIIEFGSIYEYNFLNFRKEKANITYTPFLFFGAGGHYIIHSGADNAFGVNIPMGVGFKYELDKRWNLNIESGARFTFSDEFDRVSGNSSEPDNNGNSYSLGNPGNSDWYLFTAVTITYTFYYIICPKGYEGYE